MYIPGKDLTVEVWSVLGPVPELPVLPVCLVQSNLSVLLCVHLQVSFSKSQSWDNNFPRKKKLLVLFYAS